VIALCIVLVLFGLAATTTFMLVDPGNGWLYYLLVALMCGGAFGFILFMLSLPVGSVQR
jgi:hypothetical protein